MGRQEGTTRIDPLDASGIFLSLVAVFYGTASYFESAGQSTTAYVGGMLLFLAWIAVLSTHTYLSRSQENRRISISQFFLVLGATVPLLYVVSYFSYLAVGATSGALVGSLIGIYLARGFKKEIPARLRSLVAPFFLGAALFFVLQDVGFDVLTMSSDSLAPRILKGEKTFLNKAAFGLRLPFLSVYVLSWGSPLREIIAFRLEDGRIFAKEVVDLDETSPIVRDFGLVPRDRLRGKVVFGPDRAALQRRGGGR